MGYDTIAGVAQIVAMVLFGLVMVGFLVYALRPGNKAKFDKAARLPLVVDEDAENGERKRAPVVPDENENGGDTNGRS